MSCQKDLFNQVLLIPQGKKSGRVQFHLKKNYSLMMLTPILTNLNKDLMKSKRCDSKLGKH